MERHNPVLDSEAFAAALVVLVLTDRHAYKAVVLFLFDGLTLSDIAIEMGVSRERARKLVGKAKDVIRVELEKSKPELLNIIALASRQEEDLVRKELQEIDKRFPFVDPYKIMS